MRQLYLLSLAQKAHCGHSEDMIQLLGPRPFANRKDAMDKWLEENSPERSAPPPLEESISTTNPPSDPTPTPAPAAKGVEDARL